MTAAISSSLRSGSLFQIVVGFGDPAPGGGTFTSAGRTAIDQAGSVVFRGFTSSPSRSGLFRYSAGQITQLIADGTLAPSGDRLFPNNPAISTNGAIVFTSGRNIFVLSNGVISRRVRGGDPAPDGSVFTSVSSPAMNAAGAIVFRGFTSLGNSGVFLAANGAITKVVASGDILEDGAVFFDVVGNPAINDAGEVVFAGFSDGSIASNGVFHFLDGQLKVVVPAFYASPEGFTLQFPTNAAINNSGQIAFMSQTFEQAGQGYGVFRLDENGVTSVMLPGQASPDGCNKAASDYVFAHQNGVPKKTPREWFRKCLDEAKISNFTWHCLRHTFASRLVMAGVDLRTVQQLMGHKTIQMTIRYSHLAPEHQLSAVQLLCREQEGAAADD